MAENFKSSVKGDTVTVRDCAICSAKIVDEISSCPNCGMPLIATAVRRECVLNADSCVICGSENTVSPLSVELENVRSKTKREVVVNVCSKCSQRTRIEDLTACLVAAVLVVYFTFVTFKFADCFVAGVIVWFMLNIITAFIWWVLKRYFYVGKRRLGLVEPFRSMLSDGWRLEDL